MFTEVNHVNMPRSLIKPYRPFILSRSAKNKNNDLRKNLTEAFIAI